MLKYLKKIAEILKPGHQFLAHREILFLHARTISPYFISNPLDEEYMKSEDQDDTFKQVYLENLGLYKDTTSSQELQKLEESAKTCPLAEIHAICTRYLIGEYNINANKTKLDTFITSTLLPNTEKYSQRVNFIFLQFRLSIFALNFFTILELTIA